jgi:hypothetical protein
MGLRLVSPSKMFKSIYSGSHSDAVQHYISRCKGTALPIGVNLS